MRYRTQELTRRVAGSSRVLGQIMFPRAVLGSAQTEKAVTTSEGKLFLLVLRRPSVRNSYMAGL